MTTRRRVAVILAAGLGTRMRSDKPKVLHEVLGRPMVNHVVETALNASCDEVAVVVGYAKELVMHAVLDEFGEDAPISFHVQREMLGTGDAVKSASSAFSDGDGDVVILCGDVPNVPAATIEEMLAAETDSPVRLITAHDPDGRPYGRIVRDPAGAVQRIVEAKDADHEQLAITEINTGNYTVDAAFLIEGLSNLNTDNAQGEFYLTDLIEMAADAGAPALAIVARDIAPLDGVNNRQNLARANEVALSRRLGELQLDGVTMLNDRTVWVDFGVSVGRDAMLEPNVTLMGRTTVGEGATIEAGCRLKDCAVRPGARVPANTVAEGESFGA